MMHELKTEPKYFQAVRDGKKLFEIRRNDRNFKVGELLILQEYSRFQGYTGEQTVMVVTYIMSDERYLPPGYVAMSIEFAAGDIVAAI